MFEDTVKLRGTVKIVMYRANGKREYYCFRNLVVQTGKNFIASRMIDNSVVVMSNMSVGTDPTAPGVGDTALHAEVGRVALSSALYSGPVVTYTATFSPGIGTGALQEAGIFNDPAAGAMLARVTYPLVNKGTADTMSVTWTITVT